MSGDRSVRMGIVMLGFAVLAAVASTRPAWFAVAALLVAAGFSFAGAVLDRRQR